MEPYIRISNINDFLYSPRSLYLHSIYESFAPSEYKADPQIRGTLLHECIDNGFYSSSTRYITGKPVCSEEYGIIGKIDIYDRETCTLVERKTKVHRVYEGYKLQLYAQYLALREEGYEIKSLALHSMLDNRRHKLVVPGLTDIWRLEEVLTAMRRYKIGALTEDTSSLARCDVSIYGTLSF